MCSPVKSCSSMSTAHHGCMSRRVRYRLTIWTWSREAGPLTGPLFFVFLHSSLHSRLQNLNSWTFERTVLHFPDSLLLLKVVMHHWSHSSHPSLSRSLCNSIWILSGCQGPSFVPSAPLRVQTMHQEVIAYLIPKYVSNINVWFGLVCLVVCLWFVCLRVVCLLVCL